MKNIIVGIAIGIIAITGYVVIKGDKVEPFQGGGVMIFELISVAATSSTLTITTDAQLLATSTSKNRGFFRIVNDCSSVVYINDNAGEATDITTGWRLNANGGVYTKDASQELMYYGAIRASSTNETDCSVHVSEYNVR